MTHPFSAAALFCGVALTPMLFVATHGACAQTAPATTTNAAAPSCAPRITPAQSVEDVTVLARNPVHSADGVTGLQQGGGLMKIQAALQSVSTVSKDARYRIDVRSQVFASVSTNFGSPVNTALHDV